MSSQTSTSRAAKLRQSALDQMHRIQTADAAPWHAIVAAIDRLEQPRDLVVIAVDPRMTWSSRQVPGTKVSLDEFAADRGAAVGAARLLVAVPVGRLLTQREAELLRVLRAGRPKGSWRIAAIGAERLGLLDEIAQQRLLLERMARLIAGEPVDWAPWLLRASEESEGGDDRLGADCAGLRSWLAATPDSAAVRDADLALLEELVNSTEQSERSRDADARETRTREREDRMRQLEAEARERADQIAAVAEIARQLEATIPMAASLFSAAGLLDRIAGRHAADVSADALRRAADSLWADAVAQLRHRFQAGLAVARLGTALPPVPVAPSWGEIAWPPAAPDRSRAALYGGGAGTALGFAAGKGVGAVIGGAAGALVVPLLVKALENARGGGRTGVDQALATLADQLRAAGDHALRRHLADLRMTAQRGITAPISSAV
jgi:hypothetical protein